MMEPQAHELATISLPPILCSKLTHVYLLLKDRSRSLYAAANEVEEPTARTILNRAAHACTRHHEAIQVILATRALTNSTVDGPCSSSCVYSILPHRGSPPPPVPNNSPILTTPPSTIRQEEREEARLRRQMAFQPSPYNSPSLFPNPPFPLPLSPVSDPILAHYLNVDKSNADVD